MARRENSARSGSAPPLMRARAFWKRRQYDEALRAFNDAVRQGPRDPEVLVEASQAFAARFQPARAAELLERALRLASRRGDVQREAGRVYLSLGFLPEAEQSFARASRLAVDPESQLELARLHERRHALDAADELVAAALKAAPQFLPAWLLRARIERRRGRTDQAYSTLRGVIAAHPAAPELPELYGELCVLLDALGHYDAAWDAIVQAKRLQQERAHAAESWEVAQFSLRRCTQMYDELTADHVRRWVAAPIDVPRRVALLTGFPRSGTTLIEQVLDAHPDILSTEEKEVFGAEVVPLLNAGAPPDAPLVPLLDALPDDRLASARRLYLDAMQAMHRDPIEPRIHLDKNPALTPMIPVMRRVFPELKTLIALRDPRDVVVSCFLRWMPVNPVSAWFLTLERTAERYAMDLGWWIRVRDLMSDWTEIRYEDLVADLPREARAAVTGVGAAWDDAVLNYRDRAGARPVNSPTYEAVARPVFTSSIGRWRRYGRHLAPVLDRLAPLIKGLGYDE